MKHEGANITIATSGHAVAYMGDDERGDYIYKFVSTREVRPARDPVGPPPQHGAARPRAPCTSRSSPATARDDGVYDGTGDWIPLTSDTESFVPGYLRRRRADQHPARRRPGRRDQDGPPRGHRGQPGQRQDLLRPHQQLATAAARSRSTRPTRSARAMTRARDRRAAGDPERQPQRLRPGDHRGRRRPRRDDLLAGTCSWCCGDPAAPETYFAGFPKDQVSPISCPDNVAFDGAATCGSRPTATYSAATTACSACRSRARTEARSSASSPCPSPPSRCGPLDHARPAVGLRRDAAPGRDDGATFENQTSTWPHTDAFPRPGVVVAYQL